MRVWRHRAKELFPELGEDVIHRFRADPGDIFLGVLDLVVAAHTRDDRETLLKGYRYVNWCRQQSEHLEQAADLTFYRQLLNRVSWSKLPGWLDPGVVAACLETWEHDHGSQPVTELVERIEAVPNQVVPEGTQGS